MNIKKLNEELQKFIEGYPDFSFADSEYQIDCNGNSEWDPAYHMIEVDGRYAVFAAWFTGGDYETDRRSEWFSSEDEAMDYYHKELSTEPYDDGDYDDPDEDDWLADDDDLDEAKRPKLKRRSFIQTLKEQDIEEKLISNKRFRKNKKAETDRINQE